MQYKYGVIEKFSGGEGIVVKAPQLIDLIKRDVKRGKWNVYNGGDSKHTARVSYEGKGFTYGEHIFIIGSKREIQFLESKLAKFLKVIPRHYPE